MTVVVSEAPLVSHFCSQKHLNLFMKMQQGDPKTDTLRKTDCKCKISSPGANNTSMGEKAKHSEATRQSFERITQRKHKCHLITDERDE